jgi:hypothetical protein
MRIHVGLVFIVATGQAYEVFLDEHFQLFPIDEKKAAGLTLAGLLSMA